MVLEQSKPVSPCQWFTSYGSWTTRWPERAFWAQHTAERGCCCARHASGLAWLLLPPCLSQWDGEEDDNVLMEGRERIFLSLRSHWNGTTVAKLWHTSGWAVLVEQTPRELEDLLTMSCVGKVSLLLKASAELNHTWTDRGAMLPQLCGKAWLRGRSQNCDQQARICQNLWAQVQWFLPTLNHNRFCRISSVRCWYGWEERGNADL